MKKEITPTINEWLDSNTKVKTYVNQDLIISELYQVKVAQITKYTLIDVIDFDLKHDINIVHKKLVSKLKRLKRSKK